MQSADLGVGIGREESKQVAGDLALGELAGTGRAGVDPGAEGQRPVLIECKSYRFLP